MKKVLSYQRPKQWPTRPKDATKVLKPATVHNFVISAKDVFGNPDIPLPKNLTLLRLKPNDSSGDQLFLDHVPVPREAWAFEKHDRVLTWKGAFGGGQLFIHHNGRGLHGVIGGVKNTCSVNGSARVQFTCAVANDAGVTRVSSGHAVVALAWDPSSPEWQNAAWVQDRLLLTYTVTQGGILDPTTISFVFEDLETGAMPWTPTDLEYNSTLEPAVYNGQSVWDLNFKCLEDPHIDKGFDPPTGPQSVFPAWMEAREDLFAMRIDGAMEILRQGDGPLIGMQGINNSAVVCGFYRTSSQAAPFSVFDSRLYIDGKPVAKSYMKEHELIWKGLDAKVQEKTGLPENGIMQFSRNGSKGRDFNNNISAYRLTPSAVPRAIAASKDLYPSLYKTIFDPNQPLEGPELSITDLTSMNPFVPNSSGQVVNVIQDNVNSDLYDIMNHFVPDDMWNLLFPGISKPALSPEIYDIAYSPVEGVDDPSAFYVGLATAVLTSGMADGNDPNCNNMNGPRAQQWLRQQVSSSKVYYEHGQLLFQHEWKKQFTETEDFLYDQANNYPNYESTIDDKVQKAINDINKNVIVDSDSDQGMVDTMIANVKAAGLYAKEAHLFWAFGLYYYYTTPGMLANINAQIGMGSASADNSVLGRMFQSAVAQMTIMDPSGYFAKLYNKTYNAFMSTTIITTMYGFEAADADLVKMYLDQFVANNINSEDKDMAKAAADMKAILDSEEYPNVLKESIDEIQSIADVIDDIMALPAITKKFSVWFSNSYPKLSSFTQLFSAGLVSALAGLSAFDIAMGIKSWKDLSYDEKVELVSDALQLGIQVIGAVVKRGVQAWYMFTDTSLTLATRGAAVFKLMVGAKSDVFNDSFVKVANNTARWIGDTEGTLGKEGLTEEMAAALQSVEAVSSAEDMTWLETLFGRNMDEFIGSRLGPVFILIGYGLSMYTLMFSDDHGPQLAQDILNVVSGGLAIMSMCGDWAIAGTVYAGEIMSAFFVVCGYLAIFAAIAGVAIGLYLLFKKPPDPVAKFVNEYVKTAGFYVTSRCSAIDYFMIYVDPDSKKQFVGFTLGSSGKVLQYQQDGHISLLGESSNLPECVWVCETDGVGVSRIKTVLLPKDATKVVNVCLSLMSDNTISFQPAISGIPPAKSDAADDGPTVISQYWYSSPQNKATITSDKKLISLDLTFQPILPDKDGNFPPDNAKGYLHQTDNGVEWQKDASSGTSFTLKMSGEAPYLMEMNNISLIQNTDAEGQKFGPRFAAAPSTPATYSLDGPPLPAFIRFDQGAGKLIATSSTVTPITPMHYTISVKNDLGSASADFVLSTIS